MKLTAFAPYLMAFSNSLLDQGLAQRVACRRSKRGGEFVDFCAHGFAHERIRDLRVGLVGHDRPESVQNARVEIDGLRWRPSRPRDERLLLPKNVESGNTRRQSDVQSRAAVRR